jgi:hypothetical protein
MDFTELEKETLEQLIDLHGVGSVLSLIGDICTEKAEHLRESWNEEYTAKSWDATARRMARAAAKENGAR